MQEVGQQQLEVAAVQELALHYLFQQIYMKHLEGAETKDKGEGELLEQADG